MPFQDRRQAGRQLAGQLAERQRDGGLTDPLILALPRGGLPVADEIARELRAPLDVLVVRKIGAPFNPEFAVGAVTGEEEPFYDEQALRMLGLTADDLAPEASRERTELRRRENLYREGRPPPDLRGRTVVVVDDGLATGSTARVALRAARRQDPATLVLAVPVGSPQAVGALRPEADDLLCVEQPPSFQAVGQFYADFGQVGDEEVTGILRAALSTR